MRRGRPRRAAPGFPIELILERPDLCFACFVRSDRARTRRRRSRASNSAPPISTGCDCHLSGELLRRAEPSRRLESASRVHLLAPFSGVSRSSDTTGDEIFTTVLQHAEKRIIGLENPSIEIPDKTPTMFESTNRRTAPRAPGGRCKDACSPVTAAEASSLRTAIRAGVNA